MSDEIKGTPNNVPTHGDIIIKGTISNPQPQTTRDSVSPPPAALPDTSSSGSTPTASNE